MKQYLNRIKRLEVDKGIGTTSATWLSLPPNNERYELIQIGPMNKPQERKELTESEFVGFKRELEADNNRLIEVRWET